MINRFVRSGVLLLATLNCSRICSAQDSRIYVGAAFAISPWSTQSIHSRTPSTSYSNASDDTRVTGIVAEVGWFPRPSLAIGAEIAVPFGRNTVTQTHGYFLDPYNRISRHQEETIFGVARAQTAAYGRVRLGLVGGGGFVRGSSLDKFSRGHIGSTPTPVFEPFGDEEEMTSWNLGVTFGGDVVFEVARHVSVVPQFRVLVVGRGEPGGGPSSSFADLGLHTVAYRGGIGLRAGF